MSSKILSFTACHNHHIDDHITEVSKKDLKFLIVYDTVETITFNSAQNVQQSLDNLLPERMQRRAHKLHLTVCYELLFWVGSKPILVPETYTTDSTIYNNEEEEKETEIVIGILSRLIR
jgi:hypothetical protein